MFRRGSDFVSIAISETGVGGTSLLIYINICVPSIINLGDLCLNCSCHSALRNTYADGKRRPLHHGLVYL
jgi:hypothetical protein